MTTETVPGTGITGSVSGLFVALGAGIWLAHAAAGMFAGWGWAAAAGGLWIAAGSMLWLSDGRLGPRDGPVEGFDDRRAGN